MKDFAISEQLVKKVAKLAQLPILENSVHLFTQQLSAVVGYVSKIQSLDTSKIPETSQVTGLENIFREDRVDKKRMLSQKQALSNAKRTHNGYFVVKAIFE